MDIREEFEFTLPLGYKDKDGIIHKTGVMRRSRAKDEIVLLQDMRVQRNRALHIKHIKTDLPANDPLMERPLVGVGQNV